MVAWDNASEETENQCTFNTDNKKMQNVGRLKQERTEDHKTTKSWNCIFQIIRHEADKTCIIILAYIQGAKPIIWWISSERERDSWHYYNPFYYISVHLLLFAFFLMMEWILIKKKNMIENTKSCFSNTK